VNDELTERWAAFVAQCILELQKAETDEDLREALQRIIQLIVSVTANVAIELDRVDCGRTFEEQMTKNFGSALSSAIDALRDFRARFHEEKDIVN
jgi:hypothetical protein